MHALKLVEVDGGELMEEWLQTCSCGGCACHGSWYRTHVKDVGSGNNLS